MLRCAVRTSVLMRIYTADHCAEGSYNYKTNLHCALVSQRHDDDRSLPPVGICYVEQNAGFMTPGYRGHLANRRGDPPRDTEDVH